MVFFSEGENCVAVFMLLTWGQLLWYLKHFHTREQSKGPRQIRAMGPISKIWLYLRNFRERDDVFKVWSGIYLRYFASAQKGAVLHVQGGGVFTALSKEEKFMAMKLNRPFAIFVPWSFLVVIMGACTQAADTVFLF